jgi:hypothetical protein
MRIAGALSNFFSLSPLFNTCWTWPNFGGNAKAFIGPTDFVSGYVPTTQEHMGFYVDSVTGTETYYTSNGNGSSQTTTNITGSISGAGTQGLISAIMTSGTNIKFYEGQTLLATHTTNLPTGNPDYPGVIIVNNASGNTTDNTLTLNLGYTFGYKIA